jgi:hypothetical protein
MRGVRPYVSTAYAEPAGVRDFGRAEGHRGAGVLLCFAVGKFALK